MLKNWFVMFWCEEDGVVIVDWVVLIVVLVGIGILIVIMMGSGLIDLMDKMIDDMFIFVDKYY